MGDLLLKKAAKRIQNCLRDTGRLARVGGNEFAIIAENIKRVEDVSMPAKRIIHALTQAFDLDGEEAFVGISIASDDFGIGHSSLDYLKKFPIHILKLDREFIKGVIDCPDDAMMTSIMIEMAHQLGIKVVAEGVELEQQRCFLAEKSCDIIQIYLFSPPVTANAFTASSSRTAPTHTLNDQIRKSIK